jgi:hypothetical protein
MLEDTRKVLSECLLNDTLIGRHQKYTMQSVVSSIATGKMLSPCRNQVGHKNVFHSLTTLSSPAGHHDTL